METREVLSEYSCSLSNERERERWGERERLDRGRERGR
jgi:hypothetical protein